MHNDLNSTTQKFTGGKGIVFVHYKRRLCFFFVISISKMPKIDKNYLWPIIALMSACLLKIINALLLLLVLLLLYTYKFENAIKNFKLVYQYVNYYFLFTGYSFWLIVFVIVIVAYVKQHKVKCETTTDSYAIVVLNCDDRKLTARQLTVAALTFLSAFLLLFRVFGICFCLYYY